MLSKKQTYTDDGKKNNGNTKNTQTVTVGGRQINVPTETKKPANTVKQNVTVSGRDVKVDVPQPKTVASNPAPKTSPTKPGATASAKPATSQPKKEDTYVSGRKINTNDRQNVATAKEAFAEKKSVEANELINKRNEERNSRIAANPDYVFDLYQFRNDTGVISGSEYKQRMDELNNSWANLQISFDKLGSDYAKDKNYAKYAEGFDELITIANQWEADADFLNSYSAEYNSTVTDEYETNKKRMMELVAESSYLKKNGGYLGQKERIDAEYTALKARNEELQTLVDDVNSLKDSDYHTWLLEEGDEKSIREFESYVAASDDSFVSRRVRNLATYMWTSIPYAVLSTADVAFDLLGEAAGNAMESVAKNLNENGYISDDDFNKISDVAKDLEAFEFDNENNYSQQLREYKAKVKNELEAGNIGPLDEIAGLVLDQSLENFARYNILGEYGTVLMALTTFGDSYKEAVDRGFSPTVALTGSVAKAYITWWSENLKTERYFKVLGSTAGSKIDSQFFSILSQQLVSMVPEEMTEELVEGGLDAAIDWLSYRLQPLDAEGNAIEAPEFKPGDLMKNALIAAASTTLSATLGAVKGTIYYNNAVPKINTIEEYYQFKAEQANLKEIVNTEADFDKKLQLQTFINMAQRRIDEFEKKSPTASKIELASDNVISPTIQDATKTYKEALGPTVMAMSDAQERTDSEILTVNEYFKQIAQTTLREKGIIMPYKQYLNLSDETRNVVNKISESFNNLEHSNVILAFSTDVPLGGSLEVKGDKAIITVNPNSKTLIQDIFKHEIIHLVKNSPVWQTLVSRTDEMLGDTKETKKQILRNANYSEDVLEEELVAFMNQSEYNLQTFLTTIGKSDINVLKRLGNIVNDFVGRFGKQSDADVLARQIGEAVRKVMSNPSLTSQAAMANNDADGRTKLFERLSAGQRNNGVDRLYSGEQSEQRIGNQNPNLASEKMGENAERRDNGRSSAYSVYGDTQLNNKDIQILTDNYSEKAYDTLAFLNDRIDFYLDKFASSDKPNYAQFYIAFMDPSDFEHLTPPRVGRETGVFNDEEGKTYIENYNEAPMMLFIKNEKGDTADIWTHEGRHRMNGLALAGYKKIPVLLKDENTNYSKKYHSEFTLQPQPGAVDAKAVTLENVIPFSYENKEKIYSLFGESANARRHLNKDITHLNAPAVDDQNRELSEGQRKYFANESSLFKTKDGALMTFYHSTPSQFFEFNKEKLGDNTFADNTAYGFFFTPNREFSERFKDIDGKNSTDGFTMEVYLKSVNPIIHPYYANGIDNFTKEELDEITKKWIVETAGEEVFQDFLSELEEGEYDFSSPGSLYDAFMDVSTDFDNNVFGMAADEREALQKKGYDSIILYEGTEEDVIGAEGSDKPVVSYIVFEPSQIKNVNNLDPTENDDIRYNADIDPNGLQTKLSDLPGVEFDDETLNMLNQVEESIVFTGGVTDQMLGALEQKLYDSRAYYVEGYDEITKKDINKWLRTYPLKWAALKGDNRDNLIDFQKSHPAIRFAKNGGKDWDVLAMQFEEDFPGSINASELNTAVDFINAVEEYRDSIAEANEPQRVDPGDYEEFSKQFDQIIADFIKEKGPKIATKKVSQSTLDAIERNRKAFRNSVKSWVQNYDVMREKYDIFDQEAFDDAIADVYVEGQVAEDTKQKLKESIIKNDFEGLFTGTKADQYIEDFINQAVDYYVLESEYNANREYREKVAKSANIINQASERMYEEDYDRSESAIAIDKMAESYKKRDYEAVIDLVQRVVDNINNKKNVFYNRDLKEYHDILANGNAITRNDLFELVEEPVRNAQAEEIKILQKYKAQLENLQKETGIKMNSPEDYAVGWVVEGHKQDGEQYSVDDLKKDFPKKWQAIMKVADYYKKTVKEWYEDEIDLSQKIYGDVLHENELKTAKLENQLEAARQILFRRQQDLKKNPNRKTQAGYSKAKKSFEMAEKKYNAQLKKNEEHVGTRRQFTPYRENYFHHTDEVRFFKNAKSFFETLKNGVARNNNIPTEIAGMTEYTEPRSTVQSYRWKQGQKNYSSSGFASLSHRLAEHANSMAFDPTVSYLRSVESAFRELDSDNSANNYVTWLTKYINNMAGKSNDLDRVIRDTVPAEASVAIRSLNERAKKNAVYGNLSSALVQTGNLPVGIGIAVKNGGKEALQDLVKGTAQYYLDSKAGVGIKDSSTFLKMRYFNIDLQDARFSSNIDKFGDFMITALDKVSTEQMWYMFYEQGVRLNKANPILYADQMTDRSVQGRRPEDMPLSQQSEIVKLIAPFQAEVNNQWQVMKDMAKGAIKGENKAANIAGLVALTITSAIMSFGFKKILNRDPLFNPIGALVEALSDPEATEDSITGRVIGEVIGAIPGGQYIPSLLGLSEDEAEKLFGDSDPSRYGTGNIGISALAKLLTAQTNEERQKALEEVIFTYGPSGFGKQGLRVYRAGQDFGYAPKFVNGEWRMDPIHYTSSGGVAFVNDPKDFFDFLSGVVGGQYNTKAAKEYVDSGFKKMGENGVTDPDGEVIKGSKAIMVRREMEELGIYDDVIKQITSGKMTPQKAGLSWNVINMNPEEFQQQYDNIMVQAEGIHSQISQAFDWDEDKTNSLKEAIDIEADYSNGKKVTDSEALKTRKAMEEAGIYNDVKKYIEENNLDPTTVGLGKRVMNYDEQKFLEAYAKKIKGE